MNSHINFIPGLELARRFYWEAVRPVLDAEFPGLRHSAALIGAGSEVLGFDTPMSSDHHWGPRAILFLAEDDYERQRDTITHERITESFRQFSDSTDLLSDPNWRVMLRGLYV